jgi:hypothetical protein
MERLSSLPHAIYFQELAVYQLPLISTCLPVQCGHSLCLHSCILQHMKRLLLLILRMQARHYGNCTCMLCKSIAEHRLHVLMNPDCRPHGCLPLAYWMVTGWSTLSSTSADCWNACVLTSLTADNMCSLPQHSHPAHHSLQSHPSGCPSG